jgi:magnesium transporter
MELSLIGYDPAGAWTREALSLDELLEYRNPAGITWINLNGLERPDLVQGLAALYGIHPLTAEDILDTGQRPKAEEFGEYLFVVLKAIRGGNREETDFEQISLIIMEDTVLTFQEVPGDSFNGIRRRILNNAGRSRRMGADHLAYVLMDAIVDEYFLVLDQLGNGIEEFENRALDERDDQFIPDLQKVKQRLLRLRRVVWPEREGVALLQRMDTPLLNRELMPFLKDLQDNLIQAGETVETYRELLAGVLEINLSSVSNRMNKVMKVLTIISTIFIPLTFIVGVYGMNFAHMPELEYRYAYPLTWAVMVLIAGGMLVFFKRRRWI